MAAHTLNTSPPNLFPRALVWCDPASHVRSASVRCAVLSAGPRCRVGMSHQTSFVSLTRHGSRRLVDARVERPEFCGGILPLRYGVFKVPLMQQTSPYAPTWIASHVPHLSMACYGLGHASVSTKLTPFQTYRCRRSTMMDFTCIVPKHRHRGSGHYSLPTIIVYVHHPCIDNQHAGNTDTNMDMSTL